MVKLNCRDKTKRKSVVSGIFRLDEPSASVTMFSKLMPGAGIIDPPFFFDSSHKIQLELSFETIAHRH
jgi:hypothetical protein